MNDNQIMDEFVKFGQESLRLKDENYALKQRIEELEASMPVVFLQKIEQDERDRNIKANAIKEAANAVVRGMKNYDGTDVEVVNIDELIDYAEAVRKGDL